MNIYSYVNSRPTSYSDSLGLKIYGKYLGVAINDIDWDWKIRGIKPNEPTIDDGGLSIAGMIDIWGNATYNFRIYFWETEPTCTGEKFMRGWWPMVGGSYGFSGSVPILDYPFDYVPAIGKLRKFVALNWFMKADALRLAYDELKKRMKDLAEKYGGNLDALALMICKGTKDIPAL